VGRFLRRGFACAGALALLATTATALDGEPVSAFARVGERGPRDEHAEAVTLFSVPDGRMLLVTDILVANHGQEVGPLYLADSKRTRCAVELLQTTLFGPGGFFTLANAHETFATGIPFGPGEPVIATLADGTRGVDVTITGRLVRAPRERDARVLPGGARVQADERRDAGP